MGARPEPVPQVVQTPSSSVSALLGEVHDISQVIEKIRCEPQLQEAEGEQVADKPFAIILDDLIIRRCLCGKLCHLDSEMMELGGSEMDVKLQIASCKCVCRLLFLLSDLYLRLDRAYKEDGQFNRALKAVELACLTRGCTPPYCWDFSLEEKLQKLKDLRDPKAAEFAWRMRRLTPPPKEAFLPKGDIDIQAWILAGDAYFEAQRTFDDSDVVIPHQEGEERMMSQEVEQEVHRVVTSCHCFWPRFWMRAEDYHLPRIVENKWEKNLSAAGKCYSEASALSDEYALDSEDSESECTEEEDSESECTEYVVSQNECSELTKIAYRKLGFVWHECGRRLAELGWHAKDDTDNYFVQAIDAFYRGRDLPNFALSLCSRIEYHRKLAEFRETQLNPDQGRIKILEKIRVKYQKVLKLCSEAKVRLKEWGEGLDKEVDLEEAHTHLKLGILLMEKDKIYYDKQEKPIRKGRFSADEELQKAIDWFSELDCKPEVANSQYQLGCALRDRLLFESVRSEVLWSLDKELTSIWWEATKYYIGVGDIDMYLRIRMEHSDLYSALPTKGLEQALIQLLEAIPCKMVVFGHGSSSMSQEFIWKLVELLRKMCAAAKSQRNIASSSSPSRANNYAFMARMYGCALKLSKCEGEIDYRPLYDMWKNYATVES